MYDIIVAGSQEVYLELVLLDQQVVQTDLVAETGLYLVDQEEYLLYRLYHHLARLVVETEIEIEGRQQEHPILLFCLIYRLLY